MSVDFTNLVDLAAARNGGVVEKASDDFFAPKERLILLEEPIFKPGLYTETGKWMDGWESRRKRTPGNDWCVVRLGLPGRIRGADIDTTHFVGNYPPEASLDTVDYRALDAVEDSWTTVLPMVMLKPDAHNRFEVDSHRCSTHVRLNIFPDGGIARLRVYGDVEPDWPAPAPAQSIELSALPFGGFPLKCSDEHFGSMMNLLRADQPLNMGDGWETRRRRDPGHDWVVIRLGATGILDRLELDTTYFKGNYPDRCSVDGCLTSGTSADVSEAIWSPVLDETKLGPDADHVFVDLLAHGPFTHVRLNIYPDGGVARFRAFGRLAGAVQGP